MVNLNEIKKGNLGFGFMRLPRIDGNFDYEQINKMVDKYLDSGYTHFDTAYVYPGAEVALRKSLVERHPRENYQIATKLNIMTAKSAEDFPKLFNTSLERLGTDYVDFYLLHCITDGNANKFEEWGAWDFVSQLKKEGKVRHIGFSFHGSPMCLESVLEKHPETEFVQLQINYLDWESKDVASRKCYEIARKYNKPIFIMEPVKGGSLANEQVGITDVLKKEEPEASLSSWAMRFVAELEGVYVILSGMTTLEQLEDNLATMKGLKPLTEHDKKLLQTVVDKLNAIPRIPCTTCGYCKPNCPQKIDIPTMIDIHNEYIVYNVLHSVTRRYKEWALRSSAPAGSCIACGSCEKHCPQNINIIETLEKVSDLLD